MDDSYDLYDLEGFSDFGDEDALPPTTVEAWVEASAYLERSKHYWMQTPLPTDRAPMGGAPLCDMDDETLLNMSPTLLIHMQRTAASGGTQVISPRAIGLAASFARTAHTARTTDMFLVGSIASRNTQWPTVDDADLSHLFPSQPIDAYPTVLASRPRVKTVGIMSSTDRSGDPLVKAYLTGRAIVDLQRRSDVAGAGTAVANALAQSWGVNLADYEDESEATLAPVGNLLRYAIRADEAYPMLNAPIEAKKCISVGANTAGRELYGEHAAIDWRRLRVGIESVFYMSMRNEGYNLVEMALDNPPGDPRMRPDRAGIIQFRPMPGSVWSYAPETFRLDIPNNTSIRTQVKLPPRIHEALHSFYQGARPIAVAANAGFGHSLVPTATAQVGTATRELIVRGFLHVTVSAHTFSARGKTSAAAVRDFMYQALTDDSSLASVRTLWTVRYLRETAESAGLSVVLDDHMTRLLAGRLAEVMTDLRVKLAQEAARRMEDLDTWWAAMASSLPGSLAVEREGTAAWARAAAYYLLHPYSSKWSGLVKAMAIRSHKSMATRRSRTIRLPSELRSPQRVFEAAAADAHAIGTTYGAYYSAMTDVCELLSLQCMRMGNVVACSRFKTAALMWDIRAKASSSVRVHRSDETSTRAGAYTGTTGSYHITTQPYAAYRRWVTHVSDSRFIRRAAKEHFPLAVQGPVSSAFEGRDLSLYYMGASAETRAFRYLAKPSQLAHDIERTLAAIMLDLHETFEHYENEEAPYDMEFKPSTVVESPLIDLSRFKPAPNTYWSVLGTLDQDMAVYIADEVEAMPDDQRDAIQGGMYLDGAALATAVEHVSEAPGARGSAAHELIM